MPIAITFRLDRATTARIEALADALPDRAEHRFDIVLSSHSDTVDVADLDACLATATSRWKKLSIALTGILVCPGNRGTVGLLVAPTTDLLRHHATIRRALTDLPTHPYCEIGTWAPQVMLGCADLLGDAVEVLAAAWTGPIIGAAVSLDLVRLDPVEILSSRPLRD